MAIDPSVWSRPLRRDPRRSSTSSSQPRVQALCAQYGVPYRQETILARLKKLVGIATGDAHMRVRQERSTTRETDRREVERVAS